MLQWCQGAMGTVGSLWPGGRGPLRWLDRAWQIVLSHCPDQEPGSQDTRAAPDLGIKNLSGDGDRPNLGWDVGSWVSQA